MPPQAVMDLDTSMEVDEDEMQEEDQEDDFDVEDLKTRMTMTDPHPWSAIRWYVGTTWFDIMKKNPEYDAELSFHRVQQVAERRWLTLDDPSKFPFVKLEKKDRKKAKKGVIFKSAEEILENIRQEKFEGNEVEGIRRINANQSTPQRSVEDSATADEATPGPSKKHRVPTESGESANESPKAKKQKISEDQESVTGTPKSIKKKSKEDNTVVENGLTTPKKAKKSNEEEEKFDPKSAKKSPRSANLNEEEEKLDPKSAKKSPRKKKAKDPNKPKNPTNGFMRFMNSVRESIRTANPDFSIYDVSREGGRRWKEMSEEEKAPFVKAYEEEKEQFKKNQANE